MAGAQGVNYKAQIDISGALTDIACQGDLSFNTGKALEVSRTKQCSHPYFTNSGYKAQFTIELETPMDATHTAILDAADNETVINIAIVTTDSGLPTWTGNGYVQYSDYAAPREGPVTVTVEFAWVDDPTRAAAA